jgi:hypothetical protein
MAGPVQNLLDINDTESVLSPQSEPSDFEAAFGEKLSQTLDLDTWMLGEDILSAYGRLEQEVAEALAKESEYRQKIREVVFSRLESAPGAPNNAGVYQATRGDLERVHVGLLFNGGVEACDGISTVHDTVPLTITQIGVTLASYNGDHGSWVHRLFRRDLRAHVSDPVQEVLDVLEKRERREAQGIEDGSLSELARRGIMTYAERAILPQKSDAPWRMGHGNPAPYELLTGLWSSHRDRIEVSLNLIRWYVFKHKRFVFIPSAPRKRHWLTIGNALRPLEFAIVQTLQPDIQHMIDTGGYRDESGVRPAMQEFCNEVAPDIVIGLYRVWEGAPPYLFYAHVDYAEMAAHIAMADSVLQEHRGFPMLIDLADTVCRATFGLDSFVPSVQMAYTDAGQPFRYLGERETRHR